MPGVAIIVAAHNEERRIRGKIEDCLALRYPTDRLEILVASDGSTDQTECIVRECSARDSRVCLVCNSEKRLGKSGAQNVAAQQAKGDILLFTDADTRIPSDGLKLITENFADPWVGAVSAVVHFEEPGDAISRGQGFYWRYELFLRQMESDMGVLAIGSGSALAVRRHLFRPLNPEYGDDCVIPLDVRLQGYRVVQERRAVVFDSMPHTIEGELRARIRMTARNWRGTFSRPALLNPFRYPLTALGLISHKLLRWLTPFALVVAFIASAFLAWDNRGPALCVIQVVFYLAALMGWLRERSGKSARPFSYPFSFCLANVGFFLGMVKAFRGQRIVAYSK